MYLFIKTDLINAYGECFDSNNAIKVFNSIPNDQRDTALINSMMKCHINNNQSTEAIALYDKYHNLHNDITNVLLLKACIKGNNFENGEKMIDISCLDDSI